MLRNLAVIAVVLVAPMAAPPPVGAETKDQTDPPGDEIFPGHDVLRVRYANRTGAISATTWVSELHANDQIGISMTTREANVFNYLASVKLRPSGVRARVFKVDLTNGLHLTLVCVAHARWDTSDDKVTVRAKDACFQGSDLSRVLLSTDLGVRGKNNVSDLAGGLKVRRDQ